MSTTRKSESPPNISFYGISDYWEDHTGVLHDALGKITRSGRFVGGDNTVALEQIFADDFGRKHAILVGSGSDALYFGLQVLHTSGRVILPAFGYRACLETALRAGIQIKYMDVTPDSFGMNFCTHGLDNDDEILMLVHPFGQALDAKVADSFRYRDMKILEDASQSLGAICKGRKVGTYGDISIASLDPTKPWGGIGPGGLILTDDDDYAETIRKMQWTGTKSVMSELECAAILHRYLSENEESLEFCQRRWVADSYQQNLSSEFTVQRGGLNCHSAWSKMAVLCPRGVDPMDLQDYLMACDPKIETKIHYPYTLPELEEHHTGSRSPGESSVAQDIAGRIISLPLHSQMPLEQAARVCTEVEWFLHKHQTDQEQFEEGPEILIG